MSAATGFPVFRTVILLLFVLLLSAISGCGGSGGGGGASSSDQAIPPEPVDPPPDSPLPLAVPQLTGMETVNDELWDDTAVRKVLHTFAFGGHATDAQIHTWAAIRPDLAIVQMLTFDQHLLQMYDEGLIRTTEALRWASNPEALSRHIHGIRGT